MATAFSITTILRTASTQTGTVRLTDPSTNNEI